MGLAPPPATDPDAMHPSLTGAMVAKRREAARLVQEEGLSFTEAGERVGLSRSAVAGFCSRHGIKAELTPEKRARTSRRISEHRVCALAQQAADAVMQQRVLVREAAERFGANADTVRKVLNRRGFSLRVLNTQIRLWADPEIAERRREGMRRAIANRAAQRGLAP